jgi:hypothetical protein
LKKNATNISDRRNFLRSIPVAAAAGLTIAELLPSMAFAQAAPMTEANFQVVSAQDLSETIKALAAKEGASNSKRLFADTNFLVDLWVEKANTGKEYEWHERRDHIIYVLDGATDYELGGTPKGTHANGAGEWLAPGIEGATKVSLKKGDILIIRRNTAHKRTTAQNVVFTLSAPVTPASS